VPRHVEAQTHGEAGGQEEAIKKRSVEHGEEAGRVRRRKCVGAYRKVMLRLGGT
jgi:hypothetical protein